ncbi:MAG TPA: ABC transporter substrate-binding protein [Thermomicrobiales bacterium]
MEHFSTLMRRNVSRRTALRGGLIGGLALATLRRSVWAAQSDLIPEVTIDLTAEPANLDPATTYDRDGWSVIHSVYDSLVQFGPDGEMEPLLAESLTWLDPQTYEIKLRSGLTFHNGDPVDAAAVAFSVAHVRDHPASQVAGQFAVISDIEEVDSLTVRLKLSQPAPWLPAQMAAWLAILPPGYATSNEALAKPVGTGPYRFVEWKPGERIVLEVNPAPLAGSPKGQPIAERVIVRFVPEGSTRVADLLSGTSQLIRDVPVDQVGTVEDAGATVVAAPISGSAWIRIPTDVAPFSDVRVRQALNYAVDVEAIIDALLGGNGQRLPNIFAPGGLGFDPSLEPYPYDPERAKALLAEAGYGDGFETALDIAASEHQDISEAVAGQLGEVGVKVTVQRQELANFNATWTDPESAPLRMVTWRPLFDPYTLLSLIFSNQGFLSRHDNPNAQPLIDAFATEVDPSKRAEVARQLGAVLRDEPAAIYLYSLTGLYGVAANFPAWTPRPDEYIIPTVRG